MMQHFENCRTWNDAAGKPKDIIIAGNIVNIDYIVPAGKKKTDGLITHRYRIKTNSHRG